MNRCNFCKRLIAAEDNPTLSLEGWSPMQGIPALADKLGIAVSNSLCEINTVTRLHSLLSAAGESYSLWRFDNVAGVTVGVMSGFLIGVVLGLILDILAVLPRSWNALAVGSIAGGAVGGLIGGYVWFVIERNKRARQLFLRVWQQYEMDLYKLCFAAETHSSRWIHKVAAAARKQVLFR